MSIAHQLLPELDNEMKTSRRLLERVPSDKAQWKPHPKSFALGHLTQLICRMPGWLTNALTETSLDVNQWPPYSFETTETLLKVFDTSVREAREALQKAKDADFDVMWSLKAAGTVLFSQKRREIVRTHFNHFIHHRGQLTVYLRLCDVPLPPIYGPTADERP
jgi:uncharacterized damage-inducible protein DinB